MDTQKILSALNKFKYVSFDIFDTLLKRDVNEPKDVFVLVEKEFELKYGKKTNFAEERIHAEFNARAKSRFEDITISEIYTFLDVFSHEERELLMQLELDVERNSIVPNKEMVSIYNYCVEKNKNIIITSDIYLEEDFLKELLAKNGFGIYNKLYVSSKLRLSKSTGHIWDYITSDLNIKRNSIIHIGDSIKSDYIIPKLKGIHSVLISSKKAIMSTKSKHIKLSAKEKWTFETLETFVSNHSSSNEKGLYYKIGYEFFGQFLLGFSQWMLNDIKKKNIKNVFFFSRDGFILKKAFDLINDDDSIKSHYLYVSRRSLIVPLLWMYADDYKSLIKCVLYKRYFSMKELLNNLGLNAEAYKDIVAHFGYSLDYIFKRNNIFEETAIVDLFNEIKTYIVENSKKEYDLLNAYFKQSNFSGEVAVVDIGWKASMQHSIYVIAHEAGLNLKMHGYYTGLRKETVKYVDKGIIAHGYVFDYTSEDIIHPFCGLFEFFFLAQHGSVKNYKKEKGIIKPELISYEYEKNDGSLYKEAVSSKEIQNGALDFIRNYKISTLYRILEITKNVAFFKMFQLGTKPTSETLEMFSNFSFYDVENVKMAVPKGKLYYLKKPKQLILDFANSTWRIGFLKKFFKINLPYYALYRVVKRLKEKEKDNE